jgi:hypothetical protein
MPSSRPTGIGMAVVPAVGNIVGKRGSVNRSVNAGHSTGGGKNIVGGKTDADDAHLLRIGTCAQN